MPLPSVASHSAPLRIDSDVRDESVWQACGIGRVPRGVQEVIAIEAIEAVFRADPQKSRGVFGYRVHGELREAAITIEAVEDHRCSCDWRGMLSALAMKMIAATHDACSPVPRWHAVAFP